MTAVQIARLIYAAIPAAAVFLWNHPKASAALERRDYWDFSGFILAAVSVGAWVWVMLKFFSN